MKHKYPFFFILLLVISQQIFAGNIILSKVVSNTTPKETIQVWNSDLNKKIYIYYKHDYVYSTNTNYRVSVSKQINGIYVRTENKYFPVQKGKNTSFLHIDIKEPGEYIISIIDDKGFITSEQNYTVL